MMVPGRSPRPLPGRQPTMACQAWTQHLSPPHSPCGAKHVLWRWEVAPDTHLSGSRAEIWSSCPHPCTPVAQCPAHLQERAQEQVRNPPSLGHTRGTQLCNASQEVWDCQNFWGISGKASSTPPVPLGSGGLTHHPAPQESLGQTHPSPQAVLGTLVPHRPPRH